MRFLLVVVFTLFTGGAMASDLVEPTLHIAPGGKDHPQVALTLDACDGATDDRILSVLVANKIPATLFVTGKWLRHNAAAIKTLTTHPDLFELEDHGANHIPAVLGKAKVYGITPAGTLAAVDSEVQVGAGDLMLAAGVQSHWYRDATARYSPTAIKEIGTLGYQVAGYSLNGDYGASVFAPVAARQISGAKDGDVIIAHINQPKRHSGEGVAEGILALQAKGFKFVRLEDVQTIANDDNPAGK
ncbi:MAG TPA: polysaccharide deacetylase family protein [Devosiaceae bacterium]|jgi:peptidoglycan/xylan/chitin deacetylase (PgdA/CDA1 family)